MAQVDLLLRNGKIVTQGKVVEGFVAVEGEKIPDLNDGDEPFLCGAKPSCREKIPYGLY